MAETKTTLGATEKAIKLLAIAVEKAADKIGVASDIAIAKISTAADIASNKIDNDAMRATHVVADNAATALKVSNATTNIDHDLLITLDTKITGIKDDIKDLKDGTSTKINEHEIRIFNLESIKSKQGIFITIGISAVTIILILIVYHLTGVKI